MDYSEEMVKLVVLAGMYDDEIRRKVLGTADIDNKSLNETIAIIETEEMASRSMNIGATSSQAGATNMKKQILPSDKRLQLKGKCASCQGEFLIHRVKKVGKEDVLMTDKLCKQCWQKKRGGKRGAGQAQTQVETNEASEVAQEEDFPYLAAIEAEQKSQYVGELLALDTKFQRNMSVPMPHHIFDGTRA